jgi:hypothetical protein
MPAFIAHLLIARDVFPAGFPPETRTHFLLGSVGPDLPYYGNVLGSAIGEFFEEKFNPDSPGLYTGYGDYFHARTPSAFPMKMLETIRKDKDPATQARKLAYALGYLTHIAADQHIHPFVERYAGPYYVSGLNRRKHRTIEVYEDVLLYGKIVQADFRREDFLSWFDISEQKIEERVQGIGPTLPPQTMAMITNVVAPAWFRSFIQRSFLESYSLLLKDEEPERWVTGFRSIFKFLNSVGPYHDALEKLEENDSAEAREMRDWFGGAKNYVDDWFGPARQVAAKYVQAGIEFFDSGRISEAERNRFLSVVSDADLTSPLVTI